MPEAHSYFSVIHEMTSIMETVYYRGLHISGENREPLLQVSEPG